MPPKPETNTALEDRVVELEAQLTAFRAQQTVMPAQIVAVPPPPPGRYFVIYNNTRNAISFMGNNKNEEGYVIEPKQAEKPGYIILPGEEGVKLKNNQHLERLSSGTSAPLATEWTDKAPSRNDQRPATMLKLPADQQAWVEEVVYQGPEKAEALIDTHWVDEEIGFEDFTLYRTNLAPKLRAARDYLQAMNMPHSRHRIQLITKRLKEITAQAQ